MSPQTETKAGVGFKAGVKDYRLTYYTPLAPLLLSHPCPKLGAGLQGRDVKSRITHST